MKIDAESVINVPSLTRLFGCFAPALKIEVEARDLYIVGKPILILFLT
jgi:hypothetical protein